MKRGFSPFLILLLVFLAISAVFVFYSFFSTTLERAEVAGSKEATKLTNGGILPQITGIYYLASDPKAAIAMLEYYGTEPIELSKLDFLIVLPNSTEKFSDPEKIFKADDCLDPTNSFVKPGAICYLLFNLSRIFSPQIPFNFREDAISIYPVVYSNLSAPGYFLGGGATSPSGEGNLEEFTGTVTYIFASEESSQTTETQIPKKIFGLFAVGEAAFASANYTGSGGGYYLLGWGKNLPGEPYLQPFFLVYDGSRAINPEYIYLDELPGSTTLMTGYFLQSLSFQPYPVFTGVVSNPQGRAIFAAGEAHVCALFLNGTEAGVYCWGDNSYGQLGTEEPCPEVIPLSGEVCSLPAKTPIHTSEGWPFDALPVQLVVGRYFTCALLANGSVYCWGDNAYGQLGLGDTTTRYKPTAVTALEGLNVTQLAAGAYHTCALLANGSVYCWGINFYGQLGLGDTTNRLTPTAVKALDGLNVTQLAAGADFTCALLSNGSVYCWGYNAQGQLGLGDTLDRTTPTAVTALEGLNVTQLAAGAYHTCALLENSSVYCWGSNSQGQLGLGDTTNRLSPVAVKALEGLNITRIVAGGFRTCAILKNRTIYCWGENDGTFSDVGVLDPVLTPRVVGSTFIYGKVIDLTMGYRQACAKLNISCSTMVLMGNLVCWGYNDFGQLAIGPTSYRYLPTLMAYVMPPDIETNENNYVKEVVGGSGFACLLLTNGTVYCWGSNLYGQLGIGSSTITRSTKPMVPAKLPQLGVPVAKITAGRYHVCALLANGTVYCWGSNSQGQLGLGDTTNRLAPTAVTALEGLDVVQISAGGSHTCALLENSSVYCWGYNAQGQLGLGDTLDRTTPTAVKALDGLNVTQLAAGADFTCALLSNGSVYCWGGNGFGQLGLGDTTDRNLPTAVTALEGLNINELFTSSLSMFIFALAENRSAYAWGINGFGQLGLGDTIDRNLPTAVKALDNLAVTQIATGENFACALLENNSVYCWGNNDYGQLGTGVMGKTETLPKDVEFFEYVEEVLSNPPPLPPGVGFDCDTSSGIPLEPLPGNQITGFITPAP